MYCLVVIAPKFSQSQLDLERFGSAVHAGHCRVTGWSDYGSPNHCLAYDTPIIVIAFVPFLTSSDTRSHMIGTLFRRMGMFCAFEFRLRRTRIRQPAARSPSESPNHPDARALVLRLQKCEVPYPSPRGFSTRIDSVESEKRGGCGALGHEEESMRVSRLPAIFVLTGLRIGSRDICPCIKCLGLA